MERQTRTIPTTPTSPLVPLQPSSLAVLAAAVLKQPRLFKLITSFQDGFPLRFATIVRNFVKRERSLASVEVDYGSHPHGRQLRLAHAIGCAGDAKDADELLRAWRDTPLVNLLIEINVRAVRVGKECILEWLLEHHAELPSAVDTVLLEWVCLLLLRNNVRLLTLIEKHVGTAAVLPLVRDSTFRNIAKFDASDSFRWLGARDIWASRRVIAHDVVPYAVANGSRRVLEFVFDTTTFRFEQLDLAIVARAFAASTTAKLRDRHVAPVLKWAIDEHHMPVDIQFVRELVHLRRFHCARVVAETYTRPRPLDQRSILNAAFAEQLVRDNNVRGILFVLERFDSADAVVLAGVFYQQPHTRAAVAAVVDACMTYGILLPVVENDPVFAEFMSTNSEAFSRRPRRIN